MPDEKLPDVWAKVELMGHVMLAGRITEEEKFGSKVGRIDIPQEDGSFVTQYFGGGSIYRVTIVAEAVARDMAKKTNPAPVSPWDYPKALAEAKPVPTPDLFDDEGDDVPFGHSENDRY
jgi:hypothetical protein